MALVASCSGLYFPDGEPVDNVITLAWQAPLTAASRQPFSVVLFKVKATNPHKFYIVPRYGVLFVTDHLGRKPPQPPSIAVTFGLRPQPANATESQPTRSNSDRFAVEYLLVAVDAKMHGHLTQDLARPQGHSSSTAETAARDLWERVAEGRLNATRCGTVYLQAYTKGVVRMAAGAGEGGGHYISYEAGGEETPGTTADNTSATAVATGTSSSNTTDEKGCNDVVPMNEACGPVVRNYGNDSNRRRGHYRGASRDGDAAECVTDDANDTSRRGGGCDEGQVVVPPNARLVLSMLQRKVNGKQQHNPVYVGANGDATDFPLTLAGGGELQALRHGIKALRCGPHAPTGDTNSTSLWKTSGEAPGSNEEGSNNALRRGGGCDVTSQINVKDARCWRNADVVDVTMRAPSSAEIAAAVSRRNGVPLIILLAAMCLSYALAAVLADLVVFR